VLARRAATIRKPEAVGAWLHAVAKQVAVRARKARSQRNRLQMLAEFEIGQTQPGGATTGVEWRELRPVLDEELGRLPEKYRAPVVLCYLEERSNTEAAQQLGWPVGTVKGRLARARSLLQTRLARRGVALGTGFFLTAGGSQAALGAAVPPALERSTFLQAMQVATGATPATAGASPFVATLYRGGLQAMQFAKVKFIGALVAMLGVCVFSSVFAYRALAGREPVRPVEARRAPVPSRTEKAPAGSDKKPGAAVGSTEPAGVPLVARLIGVKNSYTLDLGGKSAKDFKAEIDAIAKRPLGARRYPAAPQVDLKLELTNTSKKEIKVQVRGNANKLTLDLKGPGVVYAPVVIQNFLPIRRPPVVLTIAPGKSVTIDDMPTLGFPKPGTGSRAYWTTAGNYTLTVDYILGVSPAPAGTKDAGDGFGQVIIHTAPTPLKVVEAKK
jgi:RNA polymerase sigma factor (sigma-70 family)